jgi:hypothetical protein
VWSLLQLILVASLADALFAVVVHYPLLRMLSLVLLVLTERIFVATIVHLLSGGYLAAMWFLSSGCFAVVVVSASLVDAWQPSHLVLSRTDTLPPLLLEARLVAIVVSLHYRLPLCCCHSIIALVY